MFNRQNFVIRIDVYALGTSSVSNLELPSETRKQPRSLKKNSLFRLKERSVQPIKRRCKYLIPYNHSQNPLFESLSITCILAANAKRKG